MRGQTASSPVHHGDTEPTEVARTAGLALGTSDYVMRGTLVGLGLTLVSGGWLGSCLLPGLEAARIRPVEAMAEE
jgi:hypothetical protein